MENNERLKAAISSLEYIVKEPYILKEIDKLRGRLAEERTITNLLEIGVDPIILKQTFCNYFWAKFYKTSYENEISYHNAGERAGVPTSFSDIDYKYLEMRKLYWNKECQKIERLYIQSIKKPITKEEIKKVVEETIEKTKQNDKKIISIYEAINRYAKKTRLKKIKENIQGKNPQKINFDKLSIEQIDNLYLNKKVR